MFENHWVESSCGPHLDQWNQINETNPQLDRGDKLALVIIHCPKPLLMGDWEENVKKLQETVTGIVGYFSCKLKRKQF